MSTLLKHMTIISNNMFHPRRDEIPRLEKFVTTHGFLITDISAAVFVFWHYEFDELNGIPKDQNPVLARIMAEMTEVVVKADNAKIIPVLYSNIINVSFIDGIYSKEVLDILVKNKERYCSIIANSSSRIINFNKTVKSQWSPYVDRVSLMVFANNVSLISNSKPADFNTFNVGLYREVVDAKHSPASIVGAIHAYWLLVLIKEHPVNMALDKVATLNVLANTLRVVTETLVHEISIDSDQVVKYAFINLSKRNKCELKVINYILETPSQLEFFRRMAVSAAVNIVRNNLI